MSTITTFENNRWKKSDQAVVFRHDAVLRMIDGGSVLDLGCGDGLLLSLLRKRGLGGKGFDISDEAVARCRARGFDVDKFDFSTPNLPIGQNTYENVVLLDVLEHLYYPAALLAEAARVSKNYVIAAVPNFNSLPARLQVMLGLVPENNRPRKGHVYWFNGKILINMMEKTGLEIVEIEYNTFWSHKPIIGVLLNYLARIFPSLFALSFIVKARKCNV